MQHGWIALNSPTMWAKADLLVEHNERMAAPRSNQQYIPDWPSAFPCLQTIRSIIYKCTWSLNKGLLIPQTRFHDAYVGNHPRNPAKALLLVFFVGRALYENCPPDGTCCRVERVLARFGLFSQYLLDHLML